MNANKQFKSKQSRLVKYGDCYYDFGTKNQSFRQFSADLKRAGINNWYFALKLYDPYLINVDVYKEDADGNSLLTPEEVARIQTECFRNIWYWLREVCRIPVTGAGAHGIPYEANMGNMAQAFLFNLGIDNWTVLPRQTGKSVGAYSLLDYAYDYGTTNSQLFHLNRELPLGKEMLTAFANQRDALPAPLRYETSYNVDGSKVKERDAATLKQQPATRNRLMCKAAPGSREDAISVGRGFTIPILWVDEAEFIKWIDAITSNSAPAYRTAAEKSEEQGTVHCRLFTSTPGDLDSIAGKCAKNILKNIIPFILQMYDMTKNEILDYIHNAKAKSNNIVYIEFQWYQLGKDEEWLKSMYNEIGDDLTFRREVLLQRLHGSNNSPYSQEDIEYINDHMLRPVSSIILKKYYPLQVYKPLLKSIPYLVGVDCSTGTNGDYNAMTIIDPKTLRPVAEFRCDFIGEIAFADLIEELVLTVIPRACIIIERNHVGDAVIEYLLTKSKIGPNLYYDKGRDLVALHMKDVQDINIKLKLQAEIKKFYGSYTEGVNRKQMFTILSTRMKHNKDDFITEYITQDINTLVISANGKISAAPGEHDDNIMSYLITMYVALHGNNLHKYGIFITDTSVNDNTPKEYEPDMSILRQVLPEDVADQVEINYYGKKHTIDRLNDVIYSEDMSDINLELTPTQERSYYIKAERESALLAAKGLIKDDGYLPRDAIKDDNYIDAREIDIGTDFSIFDDLNQF